MKLLIFCLNSSVFKIIFLSCLYSADPQNLTIQYIYFLILSLKSLCSTFVYLLSFSYVCSFFLLFVFCITSLNVFIMSFMSFFNLYLLIMLYDKVVEQLLKKHVEQHAFLFVNVKAFCSKKVQTHGHQKDNSARICC